LIRNGNERSLRLRNPNVARDRLMRLLFEADDLDRGKITPEALCGAIGRTIDHNNLDVGHPLLRKQ
jgi:hypothetical protein